MTTENITGVNVAVLVAALPILLLGALAAKPPGLATAWIAPCPLYDIPLAGNARFRQLVAQLESQMRATRLE
jgi:hypothetical protein